MIRRLLLLAILTVTPVRAQESAPPPGSWRLVGAASAFYHGRSDIDRWHPGVFGGVRWNFRSFLHADLSLNRVRSQQRVTYPCLLISDTSCPDPKTETGSFSLFSLGLGINGTGVKWRPYLGIAFGQASEAIGHTALSHSGPTVTAYSGLEHRWPGDVGVFLEYRAHRQYWENDFETVLKDVHMYHHEFILGLSYTPRWPASRFNEETG